MFNLFVECYLIQILLIVFFNADVDGIMDSPPIYSRQPPDGHEFPDFQETMDTIKPLKQSPPPIKPRATWESSAFKRQNNQPTNSVRDKIAIFSNTPTNLTKKFNSSENIFMENSPEPKNSFNGTWRNPQSTISDIKCAEAPIATPSEILRPQKLVDAFCNSIPKPNLTNNVNRLSLNDAFIKDVRDSNVKDTHRRFHTRSMSLVDISDTKSDKWSMLIEQRRKGLSKLKGLVIPENILENDVATNLIIDLPEIQSNISHSFLKNEETAKDSTEDTDNNNCLPTNTRESLPSCQMISSTHEEDGNTIPKYSPAFKRKSLQIHPTSLKSADKPVNNVSPSTRISEPNITPLKNNPALSQHGKENVILQPASIVQYDAPKSLESITSPTRSDYSFEFISSNEFTKSTPTNDIKIKLRRNDILESTGPSEEESDTDSALSSSQSSYVSKSPPPSYFNEYGSNLTYSDYQKNPDMSINGNYRRLLKPRSVEAINRKNILASAKCRSGRDLKVGSPLIQRKFDEPEKLPELDPKNVNSAVPKDEPSKEIDCVNPSHPEKVDESSVSVHREEIVQARKKSFETPKNESDVKESSRSIAPSDVPKWKTVLKTTSVTDLKKNFEKSPPVPAVRHSIGSSVQVTPPPVEPRTSKKTSLPVISYAHPTQPVTKLSLVRKY